jgi:proline iminopeptidase
MRVRSIGVILAIAATLSACAREVSAPREERVDVGGASLYARDIGRGQPLIVLHGGPDFDHGYLLPDLDRLADSYRLVYYDQRGRGQSAKDVHPSDVSLSSDLDDIDKVRQHFTLDSPALFGHSWGRPIGLRRCAVRTCQLY